MTGKDTQPADGRISVLIVEDSPTIRRFLDQLVSAHPRLRVVASVESGEDALRVMERVSPDVISLDIRLPGMNGFEFTRQVMSTRPTPIVVCSASVESRDLRITMNALRAGALAVVEKPVGFTHQDYAAMAHRLCEQLVVMSRVKVVRQWGGDRGTAPSFAPRDAGKAGRASLPRRPTRMIGIVASTGGPAALTTVLGSLGRDFPVPILVVQHIAESFANGFIDWLGSVSPLEVVRADWGEVPLGGRVYVATGNSPLCLRSGRFSVEAASSVSVQRPTGDVLLRSMAEWLGPEALGVVLTGMGKDGADGLLAIRTAGGYTLAEDRSTAVVFGMPEAAGERGAVCEFLPIYAIGPRLVEMAGVRLEEANEPLSPHSAR